MRGSTAQNLVISIHALLAESDPAQGSARPVRFYFYPRSPCGERPGIQRLVALLRQFLSTLSLRRATAAKAARGRGGPYFYPRSPCGERQLRYPSRPGKINFYPRSPCGERLYTDLNSSYGALISIHALLAESDYKRTVSLTVFFRFLSTLSLRRATLTNVVSSTGTIDFYPRSPCGERHRSGPYPGQRLPISIHALLAESDLSGSPRRTGRQRFLSTLSLRRATQVARIGVNKRRISIHALLAESDKARVLKRKAGPISIHALLAESDVTVLGIQHRVGISIHALLAESDPGTV